MKGSRRLARLEELLGRHNCPACPPGLLILLDYPAEPQYCPACGRQLDVLEIEEVVVERRDQLGPDALGPAA